MRRAFLFLIGTVLGMVMLRAGNGGDKRKYDQYFLEAMMQRQKGNSDAAFDLLLRCVEVDSTQAAAYFYLSQYYNYGIKDKQKSLECLEKATALDPQNATYHETLAGNYLSANRLEDGKKQLELLREIEPGRNNIDDILVELYKQSGDYGSAIKLLEDMERADGKSEALSERKSEMFTAKGDKKAAIKEMKALTEQYPNDLNLKVKYAVTMMNNGQEKKGVELLKGVLKEEPDNTMAQFAMMDYASMNNNDALAEEMTEKLLFNKNSDSRTKIYLLQAMANQYASQGEDSTKVLKMFDRLLDLPNADPDVAMFKAVYMENQKMPKDSINNALTKVLEIAPDNAAARLRLVQNAWADDDKDKVIGLCSQARQYNPEEMVFYYFQGLAYYMKNDDDKALDACRNGVDVINEQSEPGIVADFYSMMGDILHKKGLEKDAYVAYDSCLQWKPDNLGALNNYAYYLSVGDTLLEKAEQMSYKVIKAEPENSTYLDTYAWILFQQERYSEAKIYIDQAVSHADSTENNSVIMEHAGDIYFHVGDIDGAVEKWKEALKDDKENKVLIRKVKLRKYIKN